MRRAPFLRVFLLFLVGIIVPTGFLVYLGVLSIRAETRLLNQETQTRLGKSAEAIAQQGQSLIDQALEPVTRLAAAPAAALVRDYDAARKPARLVWIDANDRLLYPIREVKKPAPAFSALSAAQRKALDDAETAQYGARDYAAALNAYRGFAGAVEDAHWKAVALNGMAGCYLKLGQTDAAETRYQELLSRYGQEQDADGNPMSLLIEHQLAELRQAQGKPDLAIAGHFRLLRDLVEGRWDLDWDSLQFFARRELTRLQSGPVRLTPDDRRRLADLEDRWNRLQRAAESARRFVQSQWPGLRTAIRAHDGLAQPTLAMPDADRLVAYAPVLPPSQGLIAGVVLVEFPSQPLLSSLKETLEPLAAASGLAARLTLGAPPPSSGTRDLVHALKRTTPPLRLTLTPVGNAPAAAAAERRRQVYLAMVFLAVLVIIVAMVATGYAVSREMEVAQLKARFVASISHELKTPLSIIDYVSQKLQLGRVQDEAEAKDYYGMIGDETARLKQLIEDVLDFSRLMENRRPLRRDRLDVAALVTQTVERFRRSVAGPLTLEYRPPAGPLEVMGDADALGRALLNLLDNAVKYSPDDRRQITVRLNQVKREVVIDVEDRGHGIPADEQRHVFDRFYRGHSASEHGAKGVGLGLSIVHHIVQSHQGRLELKSEVGKGSIFSILLPLA